MLKKATLDKLASSKNLLAFSAGGDSTALLFLLLENNITFDIAIVDYGLRLQSKEEVIYAQSLAEKYGFKCYIHSAEQLESNFEANAREVRYSFFQELITQNSYENLLTAHHLGDRFEWMLMQFCKGAGCVELSGMQESDRRSNYTLIRPLLHLEKNELLNYLNEKNIQYFEDESNSDEKYKRNYFRVNHAKPLLKQYTSGIKKSFEYMDEDSQILHKKVNIKEINDFAYFASSSKRSDIINIDRYLKTKGFLISAQERELLKEEKTVVIARKIVVNQEHGFVFIMPYLKASDMPKEFKEKMRISKIEPKLRPFIYKNTKIEKLIIALLS